MAGDFIQVGSDGAIRVKNDGIVVAGAGDPCCCVAATPCIRCVTTPSSATATLSGLTLCTTCFDLPGVGAGSIKVLSGSANGTWTLSQVPGLPCVYQATELITLATAQYVSNDCTGTNTDATDHFRVVVSARFGFGGALDIEVLIKGYDASDNLVSTYVVFRKQATFTVCIHSATHTNAITASTSCFVAESTPVTGGSANAIGYGGSMDLEFTA